MNTTDYTKLKLHQLLQLCKDRGLKGCSCLKKAALVELIGRTSSTALTETEFVMQPMITYIGNKRKLVPWIMEVIEEIYPNRRDLVVLDGFAGSGVVSRALMSFCSILHSNDMEYYSYILLRCFLETPTEEQLCRIMTHFDAISKLDMTEVGFISRLYSPANTHNIKEGERCFYTHENAMIIDTILKYIFSIEEDIRHYLLAPLIIKSSINVNTAGVFRGFYKKDGVGHFGGAAENALERILAPIRIDMPIWSNSKCVGKCYNSDINDLILGFNNQELDLIYLDPPYNEHPYASNYFMLNLISSGQEPTEYSKVSGIPKVWNKSTFNGRGSAHDAILELIRECVKKSRYVLISYNNEGLVSEDEWRDIFLELKCDVKVFQKEYDAYHGSRNLAGRAKTVMEIMYLISST